eukprot:354069-Chlamydomonas_euryale.AAC.18
MKANMHARAHRTHQPMYMYAQSCTHAVLYVRAFAFDACMRCMCVHVAAGQCHMHPAVARVRHGRRRSHHGTGDGVAAAAGRRAAARVVGRPRGAAGAARGHDPGGGDAVRTLRL